MSQSSTFCIGMAVHQDAIAVTTVALDRSAKILDLGTNSTRHGDSDNLIRKIESKATHLVYVYKAGPCGSRFSRSLSEKKATTTRPWHRLWSRRERGMG
jgi:hypothetical protein